MDTVVREFTIGYFVLCANGKDTGKWVFGRNYGQLGPKTSRPRTTRPIKKSAQDNSAQVVLISEDNSSQIAPTLEDLSAHENETRHLNVLKIIGWCTFIALYMMNKKHTQMS